MDSIKLSILIPSIISRQVDFSGLFNNLKSQARGLPVEIIPLIDDRNMSTGEKRNLLLQLAKGEYVCFFDDDDEPSKDYVSKILKAIESKPDCCSLTGVITWSGTNPEIFEHSLQYSSYKTNPQGPIIYERYPNHLNPIKRSIAINYSFIPVNHGEDTDWATRIHEDKVLQTESKIDGILYHYKFKPNK